MTLIDGEWLDFKEERDQARREAARQRAAGNFPPFYVRRIGSWGAYTPSAQVYFGRWGVFRGTVDLNNAAPDWARLGTFWRFSKACRVAYALRSAYEDGRAGRVYALGQIQK